MWVLFLSVTVPHFLVAIEIAKLIYDVLSELRKVVPQTFCVFVLRPVKNFTTGSRKLALLTFFQSNIDADFFPYKYFSFLCYYKDCTLYLSRFLPN